MEIRLIQEEDLNIILPIFIEEWSRAPYDEKWTEKTARLRLIEILQSSSQTSLCILIDNKIIGFAFCRLITWFDGKHGVIEEMIIKKQFQNQGLGTALINAVEENFKRKAVVQIDLLSILGSHAFSFFNKYNFRECDWRYLAKKI